MTGNDEAVSERAIDMCRTLNRSAAAKYCEHGVTQEDITIAALFSAFDLAEALTGSKPAALEWILRGVDLIERQLMETMQ